MKNLTKNRWAIISFIFAIVLVLSSIYLFLPKDAGTNQKEINSTSNTYITYKATTKSVYDGDTLTVLMEGREETVRLIGIDTPEMDHAPYGMQAKDFTSSLVFTPELWIMYDINNPYDRYDRLLAYVWLTAPPAPEITITGRHILDDTLNGRLICSGYAKPLAIEPHTAFSESFRETANFVKHNKLGLWAYGAFDS
jgi:micrococcal nuclease